VEQAAQATDKRGTASTTTTATTTTTAECAAV